MKFPTLCPQIRIERDERGVVRRVESQDFIMPYAIRGTIQYDWLGHLQEEHLHYFGFSKHLQYSPEGKLIQERIDISGRFAFIHNYDPKTGKKISSFLEAKNGRV